MSLSPEHSHSLATLLSTLYIGSANIQQCARLGIEKTWQKTFCESSIKRFSMQSHNKVLTKTTQHWVRNILGPFFLRVESNTLLSVRQSRIETIMMLIQARASFHISFYLNQNCHKVLTCIQWFWKISFQCWGCAHKTCSGCLTSFPSPLPPLIPLKMCSLVFRHRSSQLRLDNPQMPHLRFLEMLLIYNTVSA